MFRLNIQARRLVHAKRYFSSTNNTFRSVKTDQSKRHQLDNINPHPAFVAPEEIKYAVNFYNKAPVGESVPEGQPIDLNHSRLMSHIQNGQISDDDVLFIGSWVQLRDVDEDSKHLINGWLNQINQLLMIKDIKKEPEFCHRVMLAISPYLLDQPKMLKNMLQSLNFFNLPVKAQIKNIDRMLSTFEKQLDNLSDEQLATHMESFAIIHDIATKKTLVSEYDTSIFKVLSSNLIERYINAPKSSQFDQSFAPFAEIVTKLTHDKDVKWGSFFETPHLILFTMYYFSAKAYDIDAQFELSDKALSLMSEQYNRADDVANYKSTLALLFEEEYNYIDIRNDNRKINLENIYSRFVSHTQLVKKMNKNVSANNDNHFLKFYINSHFAYKNKNLEYFIENLDNMAQQPKNFFIGKIMFNYLSTVLSQLSSESQNSHFKHAFQLEIAFLSDSDAQILEMAIRSQHKLSILDDYKKLVLEPVVKERLKHKLLMALRHFDSETDYVDIHKRNDVVDSFIKDLDHDKNLKNQLLYHTDSPQGLVQGLLSFFKINNSSYYKGLGEEQGHLNSERIFDRFFSLGERKEAITEDGRVISFDLFNQHIRKFIAPRTSVFETLNDSDEIPDVEVTESEYNLYHYNFLRTFREFSLFEIDQKIENGLSRPIELFKKEVQSEQILARFWLWIMKVYDYSHFENNIQFYIKDHKTKSLAEKIAELGVIINSKSIKILSLNYLKLTRTEFDSKRIQTDIESYGFRDYRGFFKSKDAESALKANLALKLNLEGRNLNKLPKEVQKVASECLAAKKSIFVDNLQ